MSAWPATEIQTQTTSEAVINIQDCNCATKKKKKEAEEKEEKVYIYICDWAKGMDYTELIFPRTWTDDLMDCGFSVMGLVGIKSMPGTTSYSRPWDAWNTVWQYTTVSKTHS